MADAMTRFGFFVPISRSGMLALPNNPTKQRQYEPFMGIAFEMPMEQAFRAAVFRHYDPLKSIISNCFLGNTANIGTGYVQLSPAMTAPTIQWSSHPSPFPYHPESWNTYRPFLSHHRHAVWWKSLDEQPDASASSSFQIQEEEQDSADHMEYDPSSSQPKVTTDEDAHCIDDLYTLGWNTHDLMMPQSHPSTTYLSTLPSYTPHSPLYTPASPSIASSFSSSSMLHSPLVPFSLPSSSSSYAPRSPSPVLPTRQLTVSISLLNSLSSLEVTTSPSSSSSSTTVRMEEDSSSSSMTTTTMRMEYEPTSKF
jgi:hypothetical protein